MKIFICTSVMFICIISYVDYYFLVVCKDKATFTCKHVGLVLHKDPQQNTKHLLIFLIYGKLNYWDVFSCCCDNRAVESFSALAGHNKRVCVTVADLIPDLNLLIIIQITLSPKTKTILDMLIITYKIGQRWKKNTDITSMFAYR